MDATSISTRLMKLLEGIGTNEPVDTILPTIDSLVEEIKSVCGKAEELDFYTHHRQLAMRATVVTSEADVRLQTLVDDVYKRYRVLP